MAANGENPSQARDLAITNAQREALLILLNRLTIDVSFLNEVSDSEIADMIKAQQITGEKIAGNDYYAVFNFEFDQNSLNKFFTKTSTASAQKSSTESIILIPVKVAREKLLLWEDSNDWLSTSETIIQDRSFNNVMIPKGDIYDSGIINANNLRNAGYETVKPLLNRYKGDVAYIAYFEFDNIENKAFITLKTIRKNQNKEVKLGFINVDNLDYAKMTKKASEKLIEYILNPQNKTIDQIQVHVDLMVLISNMNDWIEVKNKIETSNLVSSIKINSISKDFVKISVNYINKDEGIVEAFAKLGLNLNQRYENYYIVQP